MNKNIYDVIFKKNVILLFSETFKNDEILRFEILKFSSENPPLFRNTLEQGGFLAWISIDYNNICENNGAIILYLYIYNI